METEQIISSEEGSLQQNQQNQPKPVPDKEARREDYRKLLFKLSVTVLVIGMACLIIGSVLTGIISHDRIVSFRVTSSSYNYEARWYRTTIGAGIWGGFWIVLAGILGLVGGTRGASNCLIYLSMAFHIIGALVAFHCSIASAMLGSSNLPYQPDGYFIAIGMVSAFGLMSFLAFLACVLQVVAASMCCPLACNEGNCCCCGNTNTAYYGGQIAYRVQPVMYQTAYPPQAYPAPNYGQQPMQYFIPAQANPGQQGAYPYSAQQGQVVMNPNPQSPYTPPTQEVHPNV